MYAEALLTVGMAAVVLQASHCNGHVHRRWDIVLQPRARIGGQVPVLSAVTGEANGRPVLNTLVVLRSPWRLTANGAYAAVRA
jgi:hypothetical protein